MIRQDADAGIVHGCVTGLPSSLFVWRNLKAEDDFWTPWELLRSFFLHYGYDLFHHDSKWRGDTAPRTQYPALDSFGLYGDRTHYLSHFYIRTAIAYASRDRKGRDVIIKAISKGEEGGHELQILKTLNSEPFRSDPANATIPVLEFLTYDDWTFAIMPRWSGCDSVPMKNVGECLEFAEQLLSGLAFLHQNLIAHLDVCSDNIFINYYGSTPVTPNSPGLSTSVAPEFRSTFPARYAFIDFGCSASFSLDSNPAQRLMTPFFITRQQRPLEMDSLFPYNPFAADVYQAARYLYAWFHDIVPHVPGLLSLLQAMSSFYPPDRISIITARDRLRNLRIKVGKEVLNGQPRFALRISHFPPVPMGIVRASHGAVRYFRHSIFQHLHNFQKKKITKS